MTKVFLDTSVLFAAIYSERGNARDLLKLAIAEKITLYVSELVLEETERNISRKAPEKLEVFQALREAIPFTVVPDPSKEDVLAAHIYTVLKDAPIIAAAIAVQPDYLVTYDRKDLLDKPEVAEKSGLRIVTPDGVVSQLTNPEEDETIN